MSEILIGTSGYDYPEWKGIFYPSDLKRKDFLSYYATQFNALEINNTFYNMPDSNRLLNFYERSEGKLQFSIKANRLLTHEISSSWENNSTDFKNAVKILQEKNSLSSILFQFPQSFHYIPENRIYLSKLIQSFQGYPVVIEFRHKEWLKDSVFEGLNKLNASFSFCDMPELKDLPNNAMNVTDFSESQQVFYLRMHGRNFTSWYSSCNERYNYSYADEELSQFTPIIDSAKRRFHKVLVFFNNHPNGSGALNAISLKKMTENLPK